VPAIIVSPWVEPGSVYNEEYRHTSLIATLRKVWDLGEAFTQRDASARTFDHVFTLDTPRDPDTWSPLHALPVPEWATDPEQIGKGLSTLGKSMGHGLIAKAREMTDKLPAELNDPATTLTPRLIVSVIKDVASHFFPLLANDTASARNIRSGY
jgi:phospholipase C